MSASIQAADIDSLDFEKSAGLLPAIVQHAETGAVLLDGRWSMQEIGAGEPIPRG